MLVERCKSKKAHEHYRPAQILTAVILGSHLGNTHGRANYGKAWPSLSKLAEEKVCVPNLGNPAREAR